MVLEPSERRCSQLYVHGKLLVDHVYVKLLHAAPLQQEKGGDVLIHVSQLSADVGAVLHRARMLVQELILLTRVNFDLPLLADVLELLVLDLA